MDFGAKDVWTVFVVMALGLISICTTYDVHGPISTGETPIVSLYGTPGTSGSFFLGTGSVGENWCYFYMTEPRDGVYVMKQSPARHTEIVEDDSIDPCIRQYGRYCTFSLFWLFPLTMKTMPTRESASYQIVVPVGTIIEGYRPQGAL